MLISTKRYLEKLKFPVSSGSIPISGRTKLIVIIPSYNEPGLKDTIQSLINCDQPDCRVEVLVFINALFECPKEILEINRKSYKELIQISLESGKKDFQIIPIYSENILNNQPGAGIPRKILMDDALRRFCEAENESGIIVSLDADCLVEKNYLTEIYEYFKNDEKLCTATIQFHHPVVHLDENDPLRKATVLYEMYLRYYRDALEYCGYPYPYYTIGSAMAVRCDAYAKAGGMGRQEAGEDFYFLQKMFPLGKTAFIDTTCVYPAARFSDRVPFGTGPALQKLAESEEPVKYTYSLESFRLLKILFDSIDDLFEKDVESIQNIFLSFPSILQDFLAEDNFYANFEEIKANTSSIPTFRKRFFNYFNAFKIVKYLNFVHPERIPLKDVCSEYKLLNTKTQSFQ